MIRGRRPLTALVALLTALAWGRGACANDLADADESFLRQARVATDGPGLLAFFRSRTLTDLDRVELQGLIEDLASGAFARRERASLRLKEYGPPALPFLRAALHRPDHEVVRRATFCIEAIEHGPGPAVPAAAARLVAARKPAGAVPVLLRYLPFNDDQAVEDEVLTALAALGVRAGSPDPALDAALRDRQPARRAGAAFVLGRHADSGRRAAVARLLTDPDPKVRLRAAQGLVAGREKAAMPALIALLADVPLPLSWQAEEQLYRVAGDRAPLISLGDGSHEARRKCRAAWAAWWRQDGNRLDLARVDEPERQLGLTLIAELDSNTVWECGPDGKPRWKIENLQGPIDAQVLPGGRVLIAENIAQRVSERDLKGNILWEQRVNQNPIACQRLPNGNTFIATYQGVMELTRAGESVYHYTGRPGFFIFGAQKLRNGHAVCITAQGSVIELDAQGKEVRTVQVTNNGGWCGIEGLPGGRLLVAVTGSGKVVELDAGGAKVWECTSVAGPCSASRLPNGNTLIASMVGQRVVEVDRTGNVVWKVETAGRPFRVHRR